MGLDIYFYDKDGNEIEDTPQLKITHNLNTVVSELGSLLGLPYYQIIWRPDELFSLKNGEVPVSLVYKILPTLIRDLIKFEDRLKDYLPSNGYGTFDDLISFLCDYLKECRLHQDKYVYCCR